MTTSRNFSDVPCYEHLNIHNYSVQGTPQRNGLLLETPSTTEDGIKTSPDDPSKVGEPDPPT